MEKRISHQARKTETERGQISSSTNRAVHRMSFALNRQSTYSLTSLTSLIISTSTQPYASYDQCWPALSFTSIYCDLCSGSATGFKFKCISPLAWLGYELTGLSICKTIPPSPLKVISSILSWGDKIAAFIHKLKEHNKSTNSN